MANLILEIVEGKQPGRQLPLFDSLEVGRDPSLPLALEDDQISRRHARFGLSATGAYVEDLESLNGTYVNGQPVQGRRAVAAGDHVRFGLTVLEVRSVDRVAFQPSAARPVPQIPEISDGVLQPVPEGDLPAARPVSPGVPSFLVEETEPAFVPPDVANDQAAQSDYRAIAALVDSRVKRQTSIAVFALLSAAGLAVLIFFGVR